MVSTESPQCSGFLYMLPPEIRLIVYGYLLTAPPEPLTSNKPTRTEQDIVLGPCRDMSGDYVTDIHGGSQWTHPPCFDGFPYNIPPRRLFPQILRACKQIHEEAHEILYRHNVFRLYTRSKVYPEKVECMVPRRLTNFITTLHVPMEAAYYNEPLATLLGQFPALRTVHGKTSWPQTYVSYQGRPNEQHEVHTLDVLEELSQIPRIKKIKCFFELKYFHGSSQDEGSDCESVRGLWLPNTLPKQQVEADIDGKNPVRTLELANFIFHRWWRKQIQAELRRRDILQDVPTAWRFLTDASGRQPFPWVEMATGVHQDHIKCEIVDRHETITGTEEL
ncbi:hypothetical protein BT63DRAFT_426857 [Microthyrium microscopicum]|uniref:DUF7730 domain-containing protein n=1 Tax=Microthyrium microscopicum TaxID=703497 RepID=A0A6A6U6X7_9PEZI|nr:hypothetical protein BT63DRAFT_426857 [Microthyrium microscopicum]